jgi:hypothetical protein
VKLGFPQNGATLDQITKIAVTGCPKAKKAVHRKKVHARRKGHAKRKAGRATQSKRPKGIPSRDSGPSGAAKASGRVEAHN